MKTQAKKVLASAISGAVLGGAEYFIHAELGSAVIIGVATFVTALIGMNLRWL